MVRASSLDFFLEERMRVVLLSLVLGVGVAGAQTRSLDRLRASSAMPLTVLASEGAAPRLVAGLLSEPSRAPAHEIVKRFLAGVNDLVDAPLAELGEPEVLPNGEGVVARFRQLHRGVPVIGGEIVVRVDGQGRVRRLAGRSFALDVDVRARLSADEAERAARQHGARGTGGVNTVALAIEPNAIGGPRLVWAVRLSPVPEILENAVYLVDAQSGAFLRRIDLLRYARASVFLANPIETPAPTARDFPSPFAPTQPDGYLESALVKGYNCIDKGEVKDLSGAGFGNFQAHICSVTPTAKAPNGDFTTYMPAKEPWAPPMNGCPNAPYGTDSPPAKQPLDEFSEQHMYWHVSNTYAFFRSLFDGNGRPDFKLRAQPISVAVNLCTPDFMGAGGFDPSKLTGPLVPFDNAFFSPGANNPISQLLINGQDSMMFGQGSKYDWAYDADVISHEFTHAVIDTLGKLVAGGAEDAWGLQDDQGAMNEGLADYFSSALNGDPKLGEYGGRNIPDTAGGGADVAVRDLTNTDLCGANRWGEVHQDSQAFSASLWGARVALAGDPQSASFDKTKAALFDRAVLAAVAAFSASEDMTAAAQSVAGEAMMLFDASAQKTVQDSFAKHGIYPVCDRLIDYVVGSKKDMLGLDGTDSPYAPAAASRVPGFVQWKIDVPAGADSITASLTLSKNQGSFSGGGGGLFGGGSAPSLELAVGPPGMPIQWTVKTDGGNQAATAPFSGNKGAITATLTNLPIGTSYVMILNSGGGAIATNITFSTSCSTGPGGCVPPDMATPHANGPTSSSRGCKCDVGGRAPLSLAPLFLVAFAAIALRRRRAR
jgi:MYXO-CTERM domain-containing protein